MKNIIAGVAAIFAAFGIANAADNDRAMGFDIANLERILASDFGALERMNVNGRTAVIVRSQAGSVVVLMPNMCDRDGVNCKGLYMQSFYSEQPSMAAINAFNQSAFVAAAVKDPGGKARLFRYLIADFGFIEGSLRADLSNFFQAGQRFYQSISQTGTANSISLTTGIDAPVSASHETPSAPLIDASVDLLRSVSFADIDEALYSKPAGASKVEQ